jgi:hypothetical protein
MKAIGPKENIERQSMSELTRRELLQLAAAAASSSVLSGEVAAADPPAGDTEIKLQGELYTRSPIEVYTNTLSVTQGEEVTIHVSTRGQHFNLQIARIGMAESVVWTKENLRGSFYPTPQDAWEKGCRWPSAVRVRIPQDWKSGYYQIKASLGSLKEPQSEYLAFVVVRATQPKAKILLVLATNTYAAYDNYGGGSLYRERHTLRYHGLIGNTGEHRVSFQRPWSPGYLYRPEEYSYAEKFDARIMGETTGIAGTSVAAGFHNWERVMVQWLERCGYEVEYAISSDLELHPQLLGNYRLMLSVGHDEYWSSGMRDTVESFVIRGGNACFFAGNICFWKVRFENQGNTLVSYKEDFRDDPHFGNRHLATGYWSSHHIGRPETHLMGLSTLYAGMARFNDAMPNGAGGFLVYRPEHWIFEGSGMTYGDCLGQASKIAHYELDGCPIRMENGLPYPADFYEGPKHLEILAMSPACFSGGEKWAAMSQQFAKEIFGADNRKAAEYVSANRGHAAMSIFTNNGTVFCAGTTDWTSGLTGDDPAVERVTKNLIDRLSV